MRRRIVYDKGVPQAIGAVSGNKGNLAVALNDRRIVFRAALAAVLISAVGLSACGRKGALQPPPSAATVDEDGNKVKDKNNGKGHSKPDRPFILDPLI
jgi:predicted small lipoprotein YifL